MHTKTSYEVGSIEPELLSKINDFLVFTKDLELLKIILDTNDLNAVEGKWGNSVLSLAIRFRDHDLVKDLMDAGANSNDKFPGVGYNAYGFAKAIGDYKLADMIWNHPYYKRTMGDRAAFVKNTVMFHVHKTLVGMRG